MVTTDYILDELLTLLKIRENYRVAVAAGEALWQQRVTRIEHVTVEDIARTGKFSVSIMIRAGVSQIVQAK